VLVVAPVQRQGEAVEMLQRWRSDRGPVPLLPRFSRLVPGEEVLVHPEPRSVIIHDNRYIGAVVEIGDEGLRLFSFHVQE
jgi:hypothetical protein